MPNGTPAAEQSIQKLLLSSDDQLYEQLGIRLTAMADDPAVAGSFEPHVVYTHAEMGLKDDMRELGRRLYRRWNRELFELACGSDKEAKGDRESLAKAFGIGDVAVAATLSGILVSSLGVAPAIAGVVAALTIRRVFRPGYEEFCKVWGEYVAPNAAAAPPTPPA
jgi:hypothetical protein